MIADEPTTAVDVTVQAEILALMKTLQVHKGTAILLITHDLGIVAEVADRVAVMYAGRIVELACRDDLLHNPAHPYTIKLMQSLPSRTRRDQALHTIEGRVPPAHALPPGCRFAPRCHMVQAACWQVDPKLIPIDTNHTAACILYDADRQGRSSTPAQVRVPPMPRPRPPGHVTVTSLLQLVGVQVYFPIRHGMLQRVSGYVKAVDGVDLDIRRGQTLALVGESGCGKTTLGKALLQLIRPTAGRVLLEGYDLTVLSRRALHPYRRRLQIIFQDPFAALDPRMMVGEIVMEGMAAHGIGASRQEREERVKTILIQVGLDPAMIHRYPHEFSGGQRQRIGIARCLAVEPDFLVCDEATSALDVSVQAQILNLLAQLQADLGLTYLFITHNLGVVEYLADEIAVMYLGRIVERGTTQEVFDRPSHPYTQALLAAVPKLDPDTGMEKIRLAGDVPSPITTTQRLSFPSTLSPCHASVPSAIPTSVSTLRIAYGQLLSLRGRRRA